MDLLSTDFDIICMRSFQDHQIHTKVYSILPTQTLLISVSCKIKNGQLFHCNLYSMVLSSQPITAHQLLAIQVTFHPMAACQIMLDCLCLLPCTTLHMQFLIL